MCLTLLRDGTMFPLAASTQQGIASSRFFYSESLIDPAATINKVSCFTLSVASDEHRQDSLQYHVMNLMFKILVNDHDLSSLLVDVLLEFSFSQLIQYLLCLQRS